MASSPISHRHTDREYEGELQSLRENVLLMGATVETLLLSAMTALEKNNEQAALEAARLDPKIDQLEVDIDSECLSILARRQPVARDLRFITTILKVVTDLERIGDLSSNICDRVVELAHDPDPPPTLQIQKMGFIAQEMVREALDSFVDRNIERARSVCARDRLVDQLYADAFAPAIEAMSKNPDHCSSALRTLSIAKYIERIADHATNISEMVIFMIEGRDVRHDGLTNAS